MALAGPMTDKSTLDKLASFYSSKFQTRRGPLYKKLLRSVEPAQKALNEDPDIELMYVDERGRPMYYQILNLTAAKTLSTNKVWSGGGHGYSLTGSSTLLGELGIWDGGGVRTTHQELTGRATQIDSPDSTNRHSTHVAGTMIAGGVVASAKGMSYEGRLACYDWKDDDSEMATAAGNGMKASNHSYDYITGWYYNSGKAKWYWYGDTGISETEDYYFGFYDSESQDWDEIAYSAPYYTIVVSAGNDRGDAGPGPGGGHYVQDSLGNWFWSTTTRDPDGGSDGYDCLDHMAIAKNVISVGSVNDIPNGYSAPSDVVMTSYSSWGPADDGRIKPDLVANGQSLYSCSNTSNTAYVTASGTSMASPNFSGSLNLLIHHYEATHSGTTPLSSTMRAVLIQTADEAGVNPGPDYVFGWGLMNTLKAADLMANDGTNPFFIREDFLSNGQRDTLYLSSNGTNHIRVTLAWADPAATPPSPSLNPTTLMLVNDLDLRLKHMESSTTYSPYVLNPSSPSSPATTGDNVRDNAEQIHLASPSAGHYMVTVSHKGTLSANQWYSIAASERLTTTAPDTTPPQVTVVRPNGGEVFYVGAQDTIKWIATDNVGVDTVSIYYSVDGGGTYPYTVATGEPNDSTYVWTIPSTLSDSCKVKVVAYDVFSNEGSDTSDSRFTIAPPPDVTPPQVTVVRPNGGEIFYAGSQDTINWIATDNVGVDSVNLYYSTDGGSTFPYTIATSEPNDSTCIWTIPGTLSDSCRVKVVAYDAALNQGSDASDNNFTIDSPPDVTPPQVTVVRPNGGEIFYVGSQDTIKWGATDNVGVDSVNIYYSIDGGATFPYTVATSEPNDSVYVWTIPDTLSDECIVKIVAYDPSLNTGEDTSDALFSIHTQIGTRPVPEVASFGLMQNYPNPFNPMTRIEFSLDERGLISVRIYDISGKLIRILVQETMSAGRHSVLWNGQDEHGGPVASGVYVCRFETKDKEAMRKVVLLR